VYDKCEDDSCDNEGQQKLASEIVDTLKHTKEDEIFVRCGHDAKAKVAVCQWATTVKN